MRWTRPRFQAGSAETRTTTSTYRRELGINGGIPDPLAEAWWRERVPETAAAADADERTGTRPPSKVVRLCFHTKRDRFQRKNERTARDVRNQSPSKAADERTAATPGRVPIPVHPHLPSSCPFPIAVDALMPMPTHAKLVFPTSPTPIHSNQLILCAVLHRLGRVREGSFLLSSSSVRPSLRVLLLSSSLLLPP